MNINVGDMVIANVLGAEDLVGTVDRFYTEDGVEMATVEYDVEVWDGDNVLDVPVESLRLA